MSHPYKNKSAEKVGHARAKSMVKSAGYAEGGGIDPLQPRHSRTRDMGGGGVGTSNVTPIARRNSVNELADRMTRMRERGLVQPEHEGNFRNYGAARMQRMGIDPEKHGYPKAPYKRGGRTKK